MEHSSLDSESLQTRCSFCCTKLKKSSLYNHTKLNCLLNPNGYFYQCKTYDSCQKIVSLESRVENLSVYDNSSAEVQELRLERLKDILDSDGNLVIMLLIFFNYSSKFI